ncbi:MAG: hypothetical protein N2321_06415 [Melioribacteraceae bacterium]|nr:hypothetical protein [Melioribacteraceae bacterium]
MKNISLFLLLSFIITGCAILKSFNDISRLKFRINNLENFNLSGVSLNNKNSLKDFSLIEITKLSTLITKGSLPFSFTLNVEAKNPENGEIELPNSEVAISSFPYKLFLNEKEILNGNIEKPVYIPTKGNSVIIPLHIEFDLIQNFRNKNIEEIISLILNLKNENSNSEKIKLITKPKIKTNLGEFEYPKELTIVEKTFN